VISLNYINKEEMELVKLRFEVFGKVQGVFFRANTKGYADSLGLKGWVQNTKRGTVVGEAEGERGKIEDMKNWLRNVGSPKSKIQDAKFKEAIITRYSFTEFRVKK
jgi:acylphosphatase